MSGQNRKIKKEKAQDVGTHQVDRKVQEGLRLMGVRMRGLVTDTEKKEQACLLIVFETQLWPSSSGSTGMRPTLGSNVLQQHCPRELSMMMEIFFTCADQDGRH